VISLFRKNLTFNKFGVKPPNTRIKKHLQGLRRMMVKQNLYQLVEAKAVFISDLPPPPQHLWMGAEDERPPLPTAYTPQPLTT